MGNFNFLAILCSRGHCFESGFVVGYLEDRVLSRRGPFGTCATLLQSFIYNVLFNFCDFRGTDQKAKIGQFC